MTDERDDPSDDDVARYVEERLIAPAAIAAELSALGVPVHVVLVSTNLEREGYTITCVGCGTQARSPHSLPAGVQAMCPTCAGASPWR